MAGERDESERKESGRKSWQDDACAHSFAQTQTQMYFDPRREEKNLFCVFRKSVLGTDLQVIIGCPNIMSVDTTDCREMSLPMPRQTMGSSYNRLPSHPLVQTWIYYCMDHYFYAKLVTGFNLL